MTDRQMMKRDRASASLGMVVERDDVGHAIVSMVVRDDMMNGHEITFLKSTTVGQTLRATARERARRGRTGLYDVTVVDETGDAVAEFRGRSVTTDRAAPVTD